MFFVRSLTLSAATALLLTASACSRPRVAVYDAPKDDAAPHAAAPEMPPPPASAPAEGALAWKLPAGWSQRDGTGMRVATLTPPGAPGTELSVVRLAGDAGGDLANVNRWRQQLGLPALATLDGASESFATPAGRALVVEARAADGRALLGAIVAHGDSSWFFKLTGPAAAVDGLKADYRSFIRSLRHADS